MVYNSHFQIGVMTRYKIFKISFALSFVNNYYFSHSLTQTHAITLTNKHVIFHKNFNSQGTQTTGS